MAIQGPEASDRALLRASGTGARTGFAHIVRRHSGVLYAIAYRQLESAADAEETVQDALMLLWTKRARIELIGESALPWLIVSVKHLAANRRRAGWRRAAHERAVPLPEPAEPSLEVQDLLRRAFDRLPAADAAVARLCLVEDLSYSEAAGRLGLTESAVRNRLSRARTRLRRDLTEEKDG